MMRVRVIGGVFTVLALLVATPLSAGAASPPSWSIEKSTNRAGVSNNLSDVSCPSTTRCVAVGAYANHTPPNTPLPAGTLIETYSAGKWATNASPGQGGVSALHSVDCPTVSRCYAIGNSHTSTDPLIVTSSGGPWTQMTAPSIPGTSYLGSISCADATHCVAVGATAEHTLALQLANGVWTTMTTPNPGAASNALLGVSCPTVTRCMAVGGRIDTSSFRTLALQLAGGTWSVVPTPNRNANGSLNGVSCTAVTRCTATGGYYVNGTSRTLVESWSGTAWSLVTSPNVGPADYDNALGQVSCFVASKCVAVGSTRGQALIQRLANGKWTVDRNQSRSRQYSVASVDCPTASTCVAVGSGFTSTLFVNKTVILRSTNG